MITCVHQAGRSLQPLPEEEVPMGLHELSDEEFAIIQPLLPNKPRGEDMSLAPPLTRACSARHRACARRFPPILPLPLMQVKRAAPYSMRVGGRSP